MKPRWADMPAKEAAQRKVLPREKALDYCIFKSLMQIVVMYHCECTKNH